jgi:hypothetical protein
VAVKNDARHQYNPQNTQKYPAHSFPQNLPLCVVPFGSYPPITPNSEYRTGLFVPNEEWEEMPET